MDHTPAKVLAEIGIDCDIDVTAKDALRVIDRELLALQPESTREGSSDRYRALMEARTAIQPKQINTAEMAGELVTIPRETLEVLLSRNVPGQESKPQAQAPGERPLRKMKQGSIAAKTKATSDFRRARTLPLAGITGVFVAIWGTREAFDATFTSLGTTFWLKAAITVGLLSAFGLAFSWAATNRDLRTLRRLYSTTAQEDALRHAIGDGIPGRISNDRGTFTRQSYIRALWLRASNPRRYYALASGLNRIDRSILRVNEGLLGLASTVDLDSALDDAADLALTRYFELGVIEAEFDGPYEVLRLTQSPEDPADSASG